MKTTKYIYMKRILISAILLFPFIISGQNAWNLDLFGQHHRGDIRYSGSWAYIDDDGNEFALLGTRTGTAIYNIDDPGLPELAFIPGPESNWREITVVGDYAYVSTEGSGSGSGMQVIDLTDLPNSASLLTTYDATFTRGHIIQSDIYNDDPFVYVIGTSAGQGVHIIDVSDPANPIEVGGYFPGYYIHDIHVKGNRIYAAAIYEGKFDIVDISDKTNPVMINSISYAPAFTHSSWTSEDNKYLFVVDEVDGLPGRVWNIEDEDNVFEVNQFVINDSSLIHNPYVRKEFLFLSHNTDGLRVMDIIDPEYPVEVGYYDTWDGPDGGFNGLWSACPYFPSGKIIGGNRHDGLYVWTHNPFYANRFNGIVEDLNTGETIPNAMITVNTNLDTLFSKVDGTFKYGSTLTQVEITTSAVGYQSKTEVIDLTSTMTHEVLLLKNGEVSTFDINYKNINIYPSPSKSQVFIDLSDLEDSFYNLKIFNTLGELLETKEINGTDLVTLENGNLNSGMYFIYLYDKKGEIKSAGKFVLKK